MNAALIPTEADLDPLGQGLSYDPHPIYAKLRRYSPIHHWKKGDLMLVSRAADVRTLLQDPRTTTDSNEWSAHPGTALFSNPGFESYARVWKSSLFTLPRDQHLKVRKLTRGAFSRNSIANMQRDIRQVVTQALDGALREQRDTLNVRTFADAIPIAVLCKALGIPDDLRASFREFSHLIVRGVVPTPDPRSLLEQAKEYDKYLPMIEDHIASRLRQTNPPDDLLTQMCRANADGETLSQDEFLSIVASLIIAGIDTTSHGMCFAIKALLEHPESLAQVRAESELLPNAIEECLRWDNFGKFSLFRYARESFEWEGIPIKKGQALCALVTSAMRDEKEFPNPEQFDIQRKNAGALNFGIGAHFCLGAFLARAELQYAISSLLIERFPKARLAGDIKIDTTHPSMRYVTDLPIELGPERTSKLRPPNRTVGSTEHPRL